MVGAAGDRGVLERVRYFRPLRLVRRLVSDFHDPGQEAGTFVDQRLA
jgi:hypothetical protein